MLSLSLPFEDLSKVSTWGLPTTHISCVGRWVFSPLGTRLEAPIISLSLSLCLYLNLHTVHVKLIQCWMLFVPQFQKPLNLKKYLKKNSDLQIKNCLVNSLFLFYEDILFLYSSGQSSNCTQNRNSVKSAPFEVNNVMIVAFSCNRFFFKVPLITNFLIR